VRRFSWRTGQKNRPGLEFLVSTGRHHGFESLAERDLLLAPDFAAAPSEVLSQPFTLRFSTACGDVLEHIPDFLAFTPAGRWLIDVRPGHLVKDADLLRFSAAGEVALSCGWGYIVVTGWHRHVMNTLDVLSSQRRALFDAFGLQAQLSEALRAGPASFEDLAQATRLPAVARAHLLHLLWHRRMGVDLAEPFDGVIEPAIRQRRQPTMAAAGVRLAVGAFLVIDGVEWQIDVLEAHVGKVVLARPGVATARIPEEVLGPLFVWAMRFIEEFSIDILAADRQWRTALSAPAEPHVYGDLPAQLRAWLGEHVAAGRPLPGWRGEPSTTGVAQALGRSPISLGRYRHLIDEAAAIVGLTPQTVGDRPVCGRLDGEPWIEAILADHTERESLAALARILQDACYLVLSFLSGARDSEIKHLKRGGLTTECDPDATPYRWKMHSLAFKGEDDPAGIPAAWSIGEPAARAITVLEQLQPPGTDHLFSRLEHSPGIKRNAVSQVLTSGATNARLNTFAAWVNDYCHRHGRLDGIPLVNNQPFHLKNSQFRRTLAWFIARRPGGVIAGALAYRHHCIQIFEGYAGTSDSGFRAEVESEQALARGEHLMAAIDAHEHTSLTGPAADEAARRLEDFGARARFQGQVVLDQARLRRVMARHDPAVYPGQYTTCVHDHTKALCERARHSRGEGLPDHGGCKPLACRNVALTAENTAAWQREIDRIDQRLEARPPLPPLLRHRLEGRLEEIIAFLGRNAPEQEPT
jgi:hypothetical protein